MTRVGMPRKSSRLLMKRVFWRKNVRKRGIRNTPKDRQRKMRSRDRCIIGRALQNPRVGVPSQSSGLLMKRALCRRIGTKRSIRITHQEGGVIIRGSTM